MLEAIPALFSEPVAAERENHEEDPAVMPAALEPVEPEPQTESLRPTTRRNLYHAPSGIRVVRFHIWQDLTAEDENRTAPLHATVTFEMTNEWYSNLCQPGGQIKITDPKGKEVVRAELLVHQAHYGLGLMQADSRQVQFIMSPAQMYIKLRDGQALRGVARMKFSDRHIRIQLPETKVIFTR